VRLIFRCTCAFGVPKPSEVLLLERWVANGGDMDAFNAPPGSMHRAEWQFGIRPDVAGLRGENNSGD